MTDSSAPAGAAAPSTDLAPADEHALDAHGHDPADYRWIPVRRERRSDGWSNARQIAFIEALADGGSVTAAAMAAGMSVSACYKLRRAPGAAGFARAWEAAIEQASRRLIDVAFERAFNGSEEPVFDREGRRVGRRMRYNDRLLMFLLRAHQPERYRLAHRADRAADEPLPAPAAPVAQALAALEPVTPADPHLLMSPEELEDALLVADLGKGELPRWYRDPVPEVVELSPDADLERALEADKRHAADRAARYEDDEEEWEEEEEEEEEDESPFRA